jgi:protoporphyrinogen oxidase
LRHVLLGYRHDLHTIDKATRLDAVSAAEFFRNWPGERLQNYLLPLLSAVMNVATPEHTSVQHLLHILRITGFTETYGLSKGLQMFPDALAEKLDVQYERPVRGLVEENGQVVGVEMAGVGDIRRADYVILAVAPIHASALLPDHYTDQKQFFDLIIKTPQALPVLYLDRPLEAKTFGYMGDPRSAGYFWVATDGAFKIPEMVPCGKSAVILWSQYPHLNELEKMADADVIRAALKEFPNLIPGASADWVEETIVYRHAFSHPPYGPGAYQAVLDFKAKSENLAGVSFIGGVFGGAYIECSLRSAEAAVARAVKD